jgi:hypothetical protein
MTYSVDFRKRALAFMNEGHAYAQLYASFKPPVYLASEHLWANYKRALPDIINRFASLQNAILTMFHLLTIIKLNSFLRGLA